MVVPSPLPWPLEVGGVQSSRLAPIAQEGKQVNTKAFITRYGMPNRAPVPTTESGPVLGSEQGRT